MKRHALEIGRIWNVGRVIISVLAMAAGGLLIALEGRRTTDAAERTTKPPAITGITRQAAWSGTVINFERSGNAAAMEGTDASSLYETLGVTFPTRPRISSAGPLAHSGTQALWNRAPGQEFGGDLLTITFNAARKVRRVRFYAGLGAGYVSPIKVTVEAWGPATSRKSPGPVLVARVERAISGTPPTRIDQLFELEAGQGQPDITELRIKYSQNATVLIDDLEFEATAGVPPSPTSAGLPTIRFLQPSEGGRFETTIRTGGRPGSADVVFRLRIDAGTRINRVNARITLPNGSMTEKAVCGVFQPCNSQAPNFGFTLDWTDAFSNPGAHTLRAEAFDDRGQSGSAMIHFAIALPAIGDIDLWVMGIEVNQGFVDRVFTDLNRRPGQPGIVTTDRAGSVPIFPGKPMVVRVYVGVRSTPGLPAPPPGGFQVTGSLLMITGAPGGRFAFNPLDNRNCAEQSGTTSGQSCKPTIGVYPSLGSQGLPTLTGNDIDLIDQRSHWEGTLNFVIPPNLTENFKGGVMLQATVEPVDRRETNPGDNGFRVDLPINAQASALPIRLVRVSLTGNPVPTRGEAERALNDMLRLTPFSRLNIISDNEFFYDGSKGSIANKSLNQCQTLWVKLFKRFGTRPESTLLALTPGGIGLDGCGGLGWWTPPVPVVYGGGGIALSRMPAYGGSVFDDMRRVTTLAQEVYHAHFDRRHVSNDHGEERGCLLKGIWETLVEDVTFGQVDADCYKPSPYAHGAIGAYPEPVMVYPRPGLVERRISGDRGGLGVRIEPDGQSWRLTLYDPCPTGPLDRANSRVTIGKRWDATSNTYRCALDDTVIPHDFMSYGPNRWTSGAQFRDKFGTQ